MEDNELIKSRGEEGEGRLQSRGEDDDVVAVKCRKQKMYNISKYLSI